MRKNVEIHVTHCPDCGTPVVSSFSADLGSVERYCPACDAFNRGAAAAFGLIGMAEAINARPPSYVENCSRCGAPEHAVTYFECECPRTSNAR